ncbi:MAG: hypothetical protein ACT4NL_12490 [Pseudomarimonas sp.]
MKTLELLAAWQTQEPQALPIKSIKTSPAFQPRAPECLSYDRRAPWRNDSVKHVLSLRQLMDAGTELDPILVARIGDDLGDDLFVIDGHHRLQAHRSKELPTIRARVLPVSRVDALRASTLCNVEKVRRFPMEAGQQREALWRYLGSLLEWGKRPDAPLPSQRVLEKNFGVAQASAGRMKKQARACDPKEYEGHLVAGLPWPYFQRVNTKHLRLMDAEVDARLGKGAAIKHRDEKRRERAAARLRKVVVDLGILEAARMLRRFNAEDNSDERREERQAVDDMLKTMHGPSDF